MPWVFLVALLLLLLKGFQWLQHLQLPLPALLVGGMSMAVLSNSGLKFPALPRPQLLKAQISPPVVVEIPPTPSPESSLVSILEPDSE